MAQKPQDMDKIKVGAFERRFAMAKASLVAGTRYATFSAGNMFAPKDERDALKSRAMSKQALYLVQEIGKLKGSVVKIGQMMALYGEHFLPEEVTEALHSLNDSSVALTWSAIELQLRAELGSLLNDLVVEHQPLGTASLAQVHRARRISDGAELVLKVQYPGVANAIDSDLGLFKNLLKVTQLAPQTKEFEDWFGEVRDMLHREVNYTVEIATTQRFYDYLNDDPRYIVPKIYPEYCTPLVICMSYEYGIPVNSPAVLGLSQARRNAIGEASLEIALREICQWGEMQTDPNFGNYLLRLATPENGNIDQIILLDFGAIRHFDENLLTVARGLLKAGAMHNKVDMVTAMMGYPFFENMPYLVKDVLSDLFLTATEPFTNPKSPQVHPESFTADGLYDWLASNLHSRLVKQGLESANNRYFSVPPKEFMFISRKFIGAYTFLTVIDAKTDSYQEGLRYFK